MIDGFVETFLMLRVRHLHTRQAGEHLDEWQYKRRDEPRVVVESIKNLMQFPISNKKGEIIWGQKRCLAF